MNSGTSQGETSTGTVLSFQRSLNRLNTNNYMRLDLFKLHNPKLDNKPKKWIVAKGKNLKQNLGGCIEELTVQGWTKPKLCRYIMQKFGVSKPTAERLIYLRKSFYPLVFIEELLKLTNKLEAKFVIQDKIEFLKVSQPPETIVKAPKYLTKNLCKIAGAHAADGTLAKDYFCITDGYWCNVKSFKNWVKNEFNLDYKILKRDKNEWMIRFHNKVFTRYLRQIFGFCNGKKVYSVGEPEIIKNSNEEMRKAFALGALTFEAGLGMKNQIEFCVASKKFQEDICDILKLAGVRFHKMKNPSGGYWRFWSNTLTEQETIKWMELFEPQTEKWFKLHEAANGYQGKADSIEEAIDILDKVYPSKPNSKVSLKKVLLAIKHLGGAHRYKIVDYLVAKGNFKSYGGKWAHGLRHYLDILKQANIISIERRRFGKKKSFGTIVREVYIFNPEVSEWKVPLRNQLTSSDVVKSQVTYSLSSTT
ncbi:MAG: hypothetical protein JW744_05355 [Candidatus Diapherotrites archaeon]|uniref:DOD-type homing endonuclease domain-containing protein n=1 Tax=Candidatus Iainarchaeum sp. TaxID=3101447 RepID=A0A938YPE8_9ARCH|nr:hypothetical protein [Candidatus Diapherotrites archaeon]